jgi:hypothetical protein
MSKFKGEEGFQERKMEGYGGGGKEGYWGKRGGSG